MYIWTIIAVVILIAAAVLVYKITKSIAKAIFLSSSILFILFLVSTVIILADVNSLKDNIASKPSLLIFEKDEKIVAAISGVFSEQMQPVSDEQLATITSNYKKGDNEAVLGSNYKLFVIQESVFNSIESVDLGDSTLSKEQVMQMLDSETPVDDYIEIIAEPGTTDIQKEAMKKSLLEQETVKDEAGFRGILFSSLLAEIEEENFMIQWINSGEITIYKETVAFKLLRYIPDPIANRILTVRSE